MPKVTETARYNKDINHQQYLSAFYGGHHYDEI